MCMAWKNNGKVCFASDSRLKFGNSSADVGIKVLSIPYRILNPAETGSDHHHSIAYSGELGMCFAGSTVNSLTIKESVVEILKSLRHAPGYTDVSMAGIAQFIFTAYKLISRRLCETDLASNGRADIIIGGLCPETSTVRVFLFTTNEQNQHALSEILATEDSHYFLGTGKECAEKDLPQNPSDVDYLNILKSVIGDASIDSVGGNIQYGEFKENQFSVYGIVELGAQVHYWRGALDLNSDEFMADHSSLIPGGPYIDPFTTIGI